MDKTIVINGDELVLNDLNLFINDVSSRRQTKC